MGPPHRACVSVGVRAALIGFVGVLARQVAADNVTINNLSPGAGFIMSCACRLVADTVEKRF
jgi:NAD(P)-dependent dehydrogenase (short-subunit alcohol dehydrogenase family)